MLLGNSFKGQEERQGTANVLSGSSGGDAVGSQVVVDGGGDSG